MLDGITPQLLFGQLLIGIMNGSFYALLAMSLAIIFGLMHVVNFAHGTQYMLGAFFAWLLLSTLGIPFWGALFIAPVMVGIVGIAMERFLLKPIAEFDNLYSLLITFAAALVIEGLIRQKYGSTGLPYAAPITGGVNLGFVFLPWYRLLIVVFSVVTCLGTWLVIEHTKLGSYLRAANENPDVVESFGINVPRMMSLTYSFGAVLAGLSGVLAAPIYQVSPSMGSSLMITIFAVVVIGGMGSILGAIMTGYLLGIVEGVTKVFYPEGAHMVIFFIMLVALIVRPHELFSRTDKS